MISSVDIDAWREDEKFSDHVRSRQKAVNHLGWAIELFTEEEGWTQVSELFKVYNAAKVQLWEHKDFWPTAEFRIYEIVKGK